MKSISKRIAAVAGALALVVVLGIALAACGSNNNSTVSATTVVNNLINAGYDIGYEGLNFDDEDYMYWMISADKTEYTYDEKGNVKDSTQYNVMVFAGKTEDIVDMMQAQCIVMRDSMIKGIEESLEESGLADNLKQAQEELAELKKDAEGNKEQIEAKNKEIANYEEQIANFNKSIEKAKAMKVVRNGMVVYYGDEVAVNAAQGK